MCAVSFVVVVVVEEVECERDSFAHATAWFAPLPPGDTAKEFEVMVSPGKGWCETYDTRSMLREPKTVITGVLFAIIAASVSK
jgi:hypothetical protein